MFFVIALLPNPLRAQCEVYPQVIAEFPATPTEIRAVVHGSINGDTVAASVLNYTNCEDVPPFGTICFDYDTAVHIYQETGGIWTETQVVTSTNPHDGLGTFVALSDQYIATSVPFHALVGDVNGSGICGDAPFCYECACYGVGSVRVFRHNGLIWELDGTLATSEPDAPRDFGSTIAATGNIVAVGAPLDSQAADQAGAVYVFRRDGSGWNLEQKLMASDARSGANFGSVLNAEGDRIVVGDALHPNGGAVYYFQRTSGIWVEQQLLLGDAFSSPLLFGISLDLSDGRLAVGAPSSSNCGSSPPYPLGAVLTFQIESNQTPLDPADDVFVLESSITEVSCYGGCYGLGFDVTSSGDRLLTGNCCGQQVFRWVGGLWVVEQHIADDSLLADFSGSIAVSVSDHNVFGESVAIYDFSDSDCNSNGLSDTCDIAYFRSVDCNGNGMPDECDLLSGTSDDCNGDSRPDECLISSDTLSGSFGLSAYIPMSPDLSISGRRAAAINLETGGVSTFVISPAGISSDAALLGSGMTPGLGTPGPVGIDGDTVIIFGENNSVVYVFRHGASGWSEEQRLTLPWAGISLDISGDTIVVGNHMAVATTGYGAIAVFNRVGSHWSLSQVIDEHDPADSDFGARIAISGNWLIVSTQGSVWPSGPYTFKRVGATWVSGPRLAPPKGVPGHLFVPQPVDVSDDVAVVGFQDLVPHELGYAFTSGAHVFRLVGDSWQYEAVVNFHDNGAIGTAAPVSVSVSGDDVALSTTYSSSAFFDTTCPATFTRIDVYGHENGIWYRTGHEIGDQGDQLGHCAIDGPTLLSIRYTPMGRELLKWNVFQDCNSNGLRDSCDLANQTSSDCDSSGVPDECKPDCNANMTPDVCDIAAATSQDCNTNQIPDECDIAGGSSTDTDSNGIPDDCEFPFGDINHSGTVSLDDILCILSAFGGNYTCAGGLANADIVPCGGNGAINLDDILAILQAFAGADLCP